MSGIESGKGHVKPKNIPFVKTNLFGLMDVVVTVGTVAFVIRAAMNPQPEMPDSMFVILIIMFMMVIPVLILWSRQVQSAEGVHSRLLHLCRRR